MSRQQTIDEALLQQFCLTIADDIELLAHLQSQELSTEQVKGLKEISFPEHFGYSLSSERAEQVLDALSVAIKQWPDEHQPLESLLDNLAADFAAIYLNHSYNASPMESVWLDEENLAYQDAMFTIRDIYKSHGVQAENWRMRSEDHMVMQLQFIAMLLRDHAGDMAILEEIAIFLDEHLLRWIDDFAERVASRCDTEFYGLLTLLTAQYLDEIRDLMAEITGQPKPTVEEIEERLNTNKAAAEAVAVPMQYVPGVSPSW